MKLCIDLTVPQLKGIEAALLHAEGAVVDMHGVEFSEVYGTTLETYFRATEKLGMAVRRLLTERGQ